MTAIAVLGGADGSLGTLLAARARGVRTVCVDMRGDAPGALIADELLNVSSTRVDELLGALGSIHDLAAVVSPASDVNLPTQFALARELGLPHGLSEAAVRASVDKGFFRDVCDRLGLAGPRYVQGTAEMVAEQARRLDLPVMVKPTDSSGSRGVSRVEDPADLAAAAADAAQFSPSGIVIAEEFVDGTCCTAEAVILDGRAALVGVSERRLTPLPHFVTIEHRMPAPTVAVDEVTPLLDALCTALDYRWGALNVDLFRAPDGRLVLGEAGARLGGNGVAELLLLTRGVDATDAYVRMALGQSVDLTPRWDRHAAMRVLQAPVAGKLTAIDGLADARAIPGVAGVVLAVQPGEQVYPYTRAGAKLGYVLACCGSDQHIETVLAHVERTLRFTIEEHE